MISEKHIERVNKVIKDMVFDYHGPILSETMIIDLQYQFVITGQKKMISVGEYYDYLIVSVEIIGGSRTATTIFAVFNSINGNLFKEYRFINKLQRDISDELQYFFGSDYVRIHFTENSIRISDEYKKEIEEIKL